MMMLTYLGTILNSKSLSLRNVSLNSPMHYQRMRLRHILGGTNYRLRQDRVLKRPKEGSYNELDA